MIYGPQFSQHINRLQPVDGDRSDDQPEERKRRRVLYQGRAWAEAEENLGLKNSIFFVSPAFQTPTETYKAEQYKTVYNWGLYYEFSDTVNLHPITMTIRFLLVLTK